jgi:uncharacterized 2Fe-2S/4Fe-4S cluster protein (DUF4445 family)
MSEAISVTFVDPDTKAGERTRQATAGETYLQVAQAAGFEVEATCGGRGRCRSCRIKILKGDVPPATIMDEVQLGHEEVHENFRLSCQTRVIADSAVMIAPPKAEVGHQILASAGLELDDRIGLDSGIEKRFVKANTPDDENHQTSDIEEILSALGDGVSAALTSDVLRKIPTVLREQRGEVTVTTFNGEVIDIEAGDSTGQSYGMSFDIGTTSIVGSLMDLQTGEELAAVGGVNPQSTYGGDLMSRIAYVQFDHKKLQTLRAKVLGAVNDFVKQACEQAGVEARHIHKLVIVGNTCMHHIFLGIDPTHVGLAPYAPAVRDPIVLAGSEVPLKTVPNARVCFLPIVAGFVGADAVACILATRIYESEEVRALVDIGTNGEVVMGSRGKLIACSAPAGPALEGAQIRHGMRGAVGAIEKVEIDDNVHCEVIGDAPAIGICGSGLVDAAAKMLDAGVMGENGRLRYDERGELPEALAERMIKNGRTSEFVLAWAKEAGRDEDITLTQLDIRQLQLAKGAICSGVFMLQNVMEVSDENLAELMLCGGFGNYINTKSAVRIRLLPALPLEKITYFGNAAALGAQMALLSETERDRATELAREVEHISLATHAAFQEMFIEAMKFPGKEIEDSLAEDGAESAAVGA